MNKINFQNGILVAKAKVTINGIVYEVEPAEYGGTTPLNAENLNQIQTNAENSINTVQSNLNTTNQNIENLTTYSTTEKIVGTWIDGKPIYRKVIESTVANIESVINNLGFDVISDIRGWAVSNYDNKWLFPNYSKADSNYSIDIYLDNYTNNINLDFGSYYNSSNVVKAIIEYTKTTN